MLKTRCATLGFLLALGTVVCLGSNAQNATDDGHWVSAWAASMQEAPKFPGLPPAPVLDNQTLRMVVRPAAGGQRVRVRLSNAFGTGALAIGSAHIAVTQEGSKIVPGTDHPLTFGGQASVKIPPGAPLVSDPVDLKVAPFTELSVSIYIPASATTSTQHFWAQHSSYIGGPGDVTAKAELPVQKTTQSWYWLAGVEVWAPRRVVTTVALGDSITDGAGAKQGDYADWPDVLAKRLAAEDDSPAMAVVNAGIGGNRILHDGAGVNVLARFDRDVLAQPGVDNLIILEGINDIGWPHMKLPGRNGAAPRENPFAGQAVTSQDLIMGLQQIIARAHAHGIQVFGATLTPYEGAGYYSADGEAVRQAVNHWIRTSRAFDGVFDFDAAVRDPEHPARFLERYDSGDHLHPSAAGYKAMADAIDTPVLRQAQK
jgi:lysophospholipase L1-like esterase